MPNVRVPVLCENYRSAIERKDEVEAQILDEIANGHYVVASEIPTITSALGAIPKKDGGVRLIHDASRPDGNALNDFATRDPVKFMTVDDAAANLTRGAWQAVVDLKSAYRVCRSREDHWTYAGIRWSFSDQLDPVYLLDTRLGFGFRRSVPAFHRLTQSVVHIMTSLGYDGVTVLLDDFHIVGDSYNECYVKMSVLMSVLRRLGFWINYSKIQMPSRRVKYLGVILDSDKMVSELPFDKVQELTADLNSVYGSKKVTRKQLERLCGKVNWASRVIIGGRFHVRRRRILNVMNSLSKPWHRTRVTQEMRADIEFWLEYLPRFNGVCEIESVSNARSQVTVFVDSSSRASGGVTEGGEFFYHPWSPSELAQLSHINFKECASFLVAARHWGSQWRGKRVHFMSDNIAACGMLRKGRTGDTGTMSSLRELFWLSVEHDFKMSVSNVPGASQLADPASRLDEPGMKAKLHGQFQLYHHFLALLQHLPDELAVARWAVLNIPPEFLPPSVLRSAGINLS